MTPNVYANWMFLTNLIAMETRIHVYSKHGNVLHFAKLYILKSSPKFTWGLSFVTKAIGAGASFYSEFDLEIVHDSKYMTWMFLTKHFR